MNQKQREYFIDRVKELTKARINEIKSIHALEIQKLSNASHDAFLEKLGLKELMSELEDITRRQDQIFNEINGTVDRLKKVYPDIEYRGYTSECNYHYRFNKFFKAICDETATNEFYKTKNGKELAELESVRQEAIDTIMLDGSKADSLKERLNSLLGGSGLSLLSA